MIETPILICSFVLNLPIFLKSRLTKIYDNVRKGPVNFDFLLQYSNNQTNPLDISIFGRPFLLHSLGEAIVSHSGR